MKWELKSNENILQSLLINGKDMMAANYGHTQQQHANDGLLKFAIDNENEVFLKYAFRYEVFDGAILCTANNITYLMEVLRDGTKTELMLNVLIFCDFGAWKPCSIEDFLDFLGEIVDPDKEQNLMYKSYNPILSICLICEFLGGIGDAISVYAHQCDGLSGDIQALGEQLIDQLDSEHIPAIFMDTDFMDRTVLKLITQGDFAPLLSHEKVFAFIDELWVGKLTNQCNGKNTDFSLLTFMASAPIKKLPGQKLEI